MATQITDRARLIRDGALAPPGASSVMIWEDTQTGQRVQRSYGTRWWLRMTWRDGTRCDYSTMKPKVAAEWIRDFDAYAIARAA